MKHRYAVCEFSRPGFRAERVHHRAIRSGRTVRGTALRTRLGRRTRPQVARPWSAGLCPVRPLRIGAPGMDAGLRVQVPRKVGLNDPSEGQRRGGNEPSEGSLERSGEPMNKNPIQGGGTWGERAYDREAPETKGSIRRSGGDAAKVRVLTQGDPASRPKGRRARARRGKSAEAVVARRSRAGQPSSPEEVGTRRAERNGE
jgi:hypothetical protein